MPDSRTNLPPAQLRQAPLFSTLIQGCYADLVPHFRLNESGTVEFDDQRAADLIIETNTPCGDGLFEVYEERRNGRIRLVVELTEEETR